MFNKPITVEKSTIMNPVTPLIESIKHVINKDIDYTLARCKSLKSDKAHGVFYARDLETDLCCAIEVKFIHPFNARNKDMLYEVVKDNTKLSLARAHTDAFTKTINLVFCSSDEKDRRDGKETVISKIRTYIEHGEVEDYNKKVYKLPEGVINIFIESYLDIESGSKETPKPIVNVILPSDPLISAFRKVL
jgi:hypothetical protein